MIKLSNPIARGVPRHSGARGAQSHFGPLLWGGRRAKQAKAAGGSGGGSLQGPPGKFFRI